MLISYVSTSIIIIFTIIGTVLESTDRRTIPFLDVLIENELKKVISNSAVQQYVGNKLLAPVFTRVFR